MITILLLCFLRKVSLFLSALYEHICTVYNVLNCLRWLLQCKQVQSTKNRFNPCCRCGRPERKVEWADVVGEFEKVMVDKKNLGYSFNFLFHKIRGDNLTSLHKVQLLRTGPGIVHFCTRNVLTFFGRCVLTFFNEDEQMLFQIPNK